MPEPQPPECPHCGTDHVSPPVLMTWPKTGKQFWECRACGWESEPVNPQSETEPEP